MKKFLITVLAVFYLGISSGATVHFHYCMGQLIDWGLSQEASEKSESCANCGMSKGESEDCCKDQQQEYKADESQKASPTFFLAKTFIAEPATYLHFTTGLFPEPGKLHPASNAPPRTSKTPAFIRHCTFRI